MRWQNDFPVMADILTTGEHGNVRLEKFTVHEYNLRAICRDHMKVGEEYTILRVGNEVMMSDTPMERESNRGILENAWGNVLIGGLGIGMVLIAIAESP